MTKSEFVELSAMMKTMYADPKFIAGQMAMNLWYEALEDLDFEDARRAFARHIQTEKFPPTPSDIRSGCVNIRDGAVKDPETAWDEAYKAIQRVNAYDPDSAKKEYAKLDAASQRAIGTPDSLIELGQMDTDTVLSVQKSQFLRDYRAISVEIRRESGVSEGVRMRLPDNGSLAALIEDKKGKETTIFDADPEMSEKAREMLCRIRTELGGAA